MHSKLSIAYLLTGLVASICATPVTPSTSVNRIPGLPFGKIVVFGDSLSDNGNDDQSSWALSGHEYPGDPAYFNHTKNRRWSNGRVWVELLALGLGVPLEDNAIGGATSDQTLIPGVINTYTPPFFPPGMIQQVQRWVGIHSPPPSDIAKTLFIIVAGANDGFNSAAVNANSTVQVINPALLAQGSASKLAQAAQTLGAIGATQFLFATYPDLSRCPINAVYGPAFQSSLKTFLTTFNPLVPTVAQQLKAANPNWKVTVADLYTLYQSIYSSPAQYGFSKGLVGCVVGSYGMPGYSLCSTSESEQNKYVFWDNVHPNALGHAYIAGAAAYSLASTY